MVSLFLSPIRDDEQWGGQENNQKTRVSEVRDDWLLVVSPELTIDYKLSCVFFLTVHSSVTTECMSYS